MKDKTMVKRVWNVLHKGDEGQNGAESERAMKDKTMVKRVWNVLHKGDEGQNGAELRVKCPS
ncbi:hypothetical protein KH400_08800 [Desertibacillus haloalkaliphilus]|nr:hypothetical protein [Desertibacillus haloalkaliphilus]